MFIKILAGTFGYQPKPGQVVPKKAGDVVEVDDAIGARLITNRVAVEVQLLDEIPEGAELEGDDKKEPDDNLDKAPEKEPDEAFPEYNAEMTRAELDAIAREMGATEEELAGAKNKAAVIALLDELKAEFEESAPALDAAAAIQ